MSFFRNYVKRREKPYEKSWEIQPRNEAKTDRQTQVFFSILRQESKKQNKLTYFD